MEAGDLIFWISNLSSDPNSNSSFDNNFDSAVLQSREEPVFHVALISNIPDSQNLEELKIVHALLSKGVVEEPLISAYQRLSLTHPNLSLRAFRVNLDRESKAKAVDYAIKKVGCAYNDVFSNQCLNSKQQEAYYCCQLVRKAYEHSEGRELFPVRKLNFRDSTGRLIPYWIQYYSNLGIEIPENDIGSHPADLLTAACLTELDIVDLKFQPSSASSLA